MNRSRPRWEKVVDQESAADGARNSRGTEGSLQYKAVREKGCSQSAGQNEPSFQGLKFRT